jgi:3-hydroxyisobutyrate dehydrogenase
MSSAPTCGVAIIGMGEVGQCFAEAIAEAVGSAGAAGLAVCDPHPRQEATALAGRLAAPLHGAPGDWLASCAIVISAVTGDVAAQMARKVGALLPPGACYLDLTTGPPGPLAAAAVELSQRGISVVDGAIMGSVGLTGARTPLLLAGPRAWDMAGWLARHGCRCSVLEDAAVGDASTLKLLRSLFTKGLEALAVECLMAAESRGLRRQFLDQLADLDETPVADYLQLLVTSHIVHARRRLAEIEAAGAEMLPQRHDSPVHSGVLERFRSTVARLDSVAVDPRAEQDVARALAWLAQQRGRRPDPSPEIEQYTNDGQDA